MIVSVPQCELMKWSALETELLREHYPTKGKVATAALIGRPAAQIRAKAWRLGLRFDRTSEFFADFQRRAAQSKVGKRRPAQAGVMKSLHAAGKLAITPAGRAAIGENTKRHILANGHPRGMLGVKHTPETLAKVSAASRRAWRSKTPKEIRDQVEKQLRTRAANGTMAPDRRRGSWRAAWRTIGGKRKFYRSKWEANYARYLEWQKNRGDIADWHHEPETFWFDGVKRGCVSYLPDFRVTAVGGGVEYHEVKGWMDYKSKTKIKRMKKYHPTVKLVVIDSAGYRDLEKYFSLTVPGWE